MDITKSKIRKVLDNYSLFDTEIGKKCKYKGLRGKIAEKKRDMLKKT